MCIFNLKMDIFSLKIEFSSWSFYFFSPTFQVFFSSIERMNAENKNVIIIVTCLIFYFSAGDTIIN